jgi:ribonuclease HI
MIADRAWLKLEENLQRAGEKPAPSLAAIESINGWIGQQGAAYRRDDVRMVYTGIASRAQEAGFDEIPYCEEVATRWYQAYLRDWANPRESLRIRGLDMGSATECADGFADQHCDFATIHGRGGLTCLTDTPPQTVPPIRREVFLYCDGSCLHRHGVGGWAFLVSEPETGWQDAQAGSEERTTNNRMELMAVIEGLASLQDSTLVHLVVDSEYVHLGITERLATWVSNGWRAGRIRTRPLKNLELWQRLAAQLDRHDVDSQWVRAHSGQEQNDLVDRLAKDAVIMRCMQMTS